MSKVFIVSEVPELYKYDKDYNIKPGPVPCCTQRAISQHVFDDQESATTFFNNCNCRVFLDTTTHVVITAFTLDEFETIPGCDKYRHIRFITGKNYKG